MKLARNWSQLQAIAPPEALTSQRQVFKLLDALIAGERPPIEATTGRKKRAKGAVPALPASPQSLSPPAAADEGWRLAAKKLHQRTLRELEEQPTSGVLAAALPGS